MSAILIVVLISLLTGDVSGLLCYSCAGIRSSDECMNVTECHGPEGCFTRADGQQSGEVLYTIGCTVNREAVVTERTFCSELCHGDLCNLDKCHLPVFPSTCFNLTRPPRCLSCDLVRDTGQCTTFVQCKDNELCFARKVMVYGQVRIRLGCMDKQHCLSPHSSGGTGATIVGKRQLPNAQHNCSVCCSKDRCNALACEHQQQPAIGESAADIGDSQVLQQIGDDKDCFDFNPIACASFGKLETDACKILPDVDTLCPESCAMCGHFGWGQWSSWSTCSKSCNNGTSERRRICLHQLDVTKNNTCNGLDMDRTSCNDVPCAVDGQWSAWEMWSGCSVSCGNGTWTRRRHCTNPEPKHGGMNCFGDGIEVSICSRNLCRVDGGWCYTYNPCYNYISGYTGYQSIRCHVESKTGSTEFVPYHRGECNCPAPQNGGMRCV